MTQITPASRNWFQPKLKVQASRMSVSSSTISHAPRVARKRASSARPVRRPWRKAPAPARNTNTGAQKCVTQRIAKSCGEMLASGPSGSAEKYTRTWSSAIKTITAPRRTSTPAKRSLARATVAGAGTTRATGLWTGETVIWPSLSPPRVEARAPFRAKAGYGVGSGWCSRADGIPLDILGERWDPLTREDDHGQRSTRAPARDPRPPDPEGARLRRCPRLHDRAAHPGALGRRDPGGRGLALSGAAPPGAPGLAGIRVGDLGGEPAREVLPALALRPARARGTRARLGVDVARHRGRAGGGGRRVSWLEALGLFRRAPDPRSAAEIEADVQAEIDHHLACKERELIEQGQAPERARAEALERFGDVA